MLILRVAFMAFLFIVVFSLGIFIWIKDTDVRWEKTYKYKAQKEIIKLVKPKCIREYNETSN